MPIVRTDGPSRSVVPAELKSYIDELVERLRRRLHDQLVGVYLHGSASMRAFVPSRSDVDVLVITSGPIPTQVKPLIAGDLSADALPCPGVGLELHVVDVCALGDTDAPAFQLHLDMHEGHPARVEDGADHPGDSDLIAHFAMAKAHAIALLGPPAATVFPTIDRGRLIRTFVEDLGWGLEHGHVGYAVLNACRALRFAREGVLSSKPEGGTWAIEHGIGDRATVQTALRRQSGSDEDVDAEAGAAFVENVLRELRT